jgi:hypothetical protein
MGRKLSETASAVRKRKAALPSLAEGLMRASRRGDADSLIAYFRSGIAERRFRLAPLQPRTVAAKARRGEPNPAAPLYGMGLPEARSYVRALKRYRARRGWVVRFPAARHHSSKLTMDKLHEVHEYGAVFVSKSGSVWRMPPRPALTKAYEMVIRDQRDRDPSAEVRRACAEHLRLGRSVTAARMEAYARKMEALIGS